MNHYSSATGNRPSSFALLALMLAAGAKLLTASTYGQSDNFDSGTDAGWVHADVLAAYGGPNTYSFPDGPFGKGYRIRCNSSPVLAGACGACGTARAYVYRTNVYTDFYVAADLIQWDNTLDQACVVGARITGADVSADPCPLPGPCPPGFGTTSGYVCNYDCNQDGATAGDRLGGELQINRVDQESPTTLASAEVTLLPGKAYRIVFKGVGQTLTGQLYDLEDLTAPIATIQAQDSQYTSGVSGLISYSRDATVSDATFDNYFAAASDPNEDIAPAIRHPVPGTPQLVTRSPASRFAGLYPSVSGINFSVRTFATNTIGAGATKLYLNGADVSSALVPSPGGFGTNISYVLTAGTLASDTVYSAQVEVQDASGNLKSTNTFWFDTFSNAFLTNGLVKTVEVEDYNYSNGVFQLDPVAVSGIDTNGAQINPNLGYYALAGTPEIDYHDNRTSPEGGWNDYRPDDYVGTLQGNREDIEDLNHPAPTTPPVSDPTRPDDNLRVQYAAARLKEYEVSRTEAGEWLNYTRVFADTNYYVFLRCGSFGVQDVLLDLVGGNPATTNQTTSPLGVFSVPNHLMRLNYRFEPLMVGGSRAVVHLGGTNTLRLTIGGKPNKDSRLLSLNYLLFVPASEGLTVSDNFNDGNDTAPSPAWLRYDPIQAGSWSFPGGNTYRIQSAPSPDPANFGQGRAGSIKPSNYSDFYVSVDVVGWDDSIHQVFGLLARVGTPGPGTTIGYMFTHDRGNPTSDTSGDMDIVRLDNELPTTLDPSGSPDRIHFETNKQYRIVFMGNGSTLTGQVYELPNTAVPVVSYSATDDTYIGGSVGLVVANNSSETGFDGPADATFDNFVATTAEPRLSIGTSASGITLSWPLIGFVLQTSPSLSSPVWVPVTSGITQSGNLNVYHVPSGGAAGFYRLAAP